MPKNEVGCILEARFMTVEDISTRLECCRRYRSRLDTREKTSCLSSRGKNIKSHFVDYEHFLEQRRTVDGDFRKGD